MSFLRDTRVAAVQAWLYKAAPAPEVAAEEWRTQGVALLTAGVAWDAVRVPYAPLGLVREDAPDTIRRRLGDLQVIGPVFADPYRPNLYVLVPPGTDRAWSSALAPAGVECLGGTPPYVRCVGVPRLDRVARPGPFWVTPPDSPDHLADPQQLYRTLHAHAREAAATKRQNSASRVTS
jgi:hypothetical protein